MKRALRIHVAVRRRVQLGRVPFQGVGAELLDVHGHGRGQSLGTQDVEAHRAAVRVPPRGQPVRLAGLVARHERLAIRDRRGGSGEDGDLRPGGGGWGWTNRHACAPSSWTLG